ncbi:MAG: hypothetical protein V4516_08940 [Pseudomonadota bacterium]
MFGKMRLFAARALFALVIVMSLGFGLLIAGAAAVLGLMVIATIRIAMIGSGERYRRRAADEDRQQPAGRDEAAQPA